MELILCVAVGILFSVGVYLILSKSLLKIILGTSLLTHGVHLLVMTMAGLKRGDSPILGDNSGSYVDPLPQALILTSIVISFGITAFFFVLAYRTNQTTGTEVTDDREGGEAANE